MSPGGQLAAGEHSANRAHHEPHVHLPQSSHRVNCFPRLIISIIFASAFALAEGRLHQKNNLFGLSFFHAMLIIYANYKLPNLALIVFF